MADDKEVLIVEAGGTQESLEGHKANPSPYARLTVFPVSYWLYCRSNLTTFIRLHGRPLFSAILTIISVTGIFAFFPIYLDKVTGDDESDGFAVALTLTCLSTTVFLLVGVFLKIWLLVVKGHRYPHHVFKRTSSWCGIMKMGISSGLSLLTVCYSWEDYKVLCNLQLPLLGFIFVFATIMYAISNWKGLGYRRSFAVLGIIGGIFISVDYTMVDHERCRGIHPPPVDPWTWKVHVVWTLAYLVAIWLWTVAVFSMDHSIIPIYGPQPLVKCGTDPGLKMRVLHVSSLDPDLPTTGLRTKTILPLSRDEIYRKIPMVSIFNKLLWFNLATFVVVASLFWTEFIPGFGKAVRDDSLSLTDVLQNGVVQSISNIEFWTLLVSTFTFGHSFTHLLLSTRSPLITFGVMSLGFPIVTIWWSLFQMEYPYLLWMPMITEVICSVIGFPLILIGLFYLSFLDILPA